MIRTVKSFSAEIFVVGMSFLSTGSATRHRSGLTSRLWAKICSSKFSWHFQHCMTSRSLSSFQILWERRRYSPKFTPARSGRLEVGRILAQHKQGLKAPGPFSAHVHGFLPSVFDSMFRPKAADRLNNAAYFELADFSLEFFLKDWHVFLGP